MSSSRRLLAAALLALPVPAAAQGAAKTTAAAEPASNRAAGRGAERAGPADPSLARAYTLVINGDGTAGRRMVDSLLAAAPPGSARYAEVLYWRAAFAATTDDAQRDYRRLSVEFPLSPRAADALIALAQLEYVRGDKTLAVHHLQRLMIEHPAGVRSAKANFWAARVLFEAKDPERACAALRAARATAGPGEVELRNQVESEIPKCGVRRPAVASSAPAKRGQASPAASVAAASARGTATAEGAAERTAERSAEARESDGGAVRGAGNGATTAATAATSTRRPAAAEPREPRAAAPATGAARSVGYSVQVAAYSSRPEAEALAAKLAARGHAARVSGSVAPFRVRVGRYGSYAEATGQLKRMQAQKLGGIVVAAEPR